MRITTMTVSQQASFGMPSHVRALSVCTGSKPWATAGATRAFVDATPDAAYIRAGVAVLEGTFPGTSAWSPPI